MILLAPKNGGGDGCITHQIEVTLVRAGMIYFSLDSKQNISERRVQTYVFLKESISQKVFAKKMIFFLCTLYIIRRVRSTFLLTT